MSGILYIFDEPSKGLGCEDYEKVASLLAQLRDEGNTILMVEHNEDMIRIADHVIEIGPQAGIYGGRIMGAGSIEEVISMKKTQISKYLGTERKCLESRKRADKNKYEMIYLSNLTCNNLKNISVSFPKNALTCIYGPSGSGKSSLLKGELYPIFKKSKQFADVVLVDQQPIGKNSRSILATYLGIMDAIRIKMAASDDAIRLGYDEKMFSFNGTSGQCPTCCGEGRVKIKYMEHAYVVCPDCRGKRYKKDILQVRIQEKSIGDILELSVIDAIQFFHEDIDIVTKLKLVEQVGMGYLLLGQCTATLSGGEASRLKLAKELSIGKQKNVLYLLDEPTTGLHFSDIDLILLLIRKLIEKANTVVVIEHNKQFSLSCDWFIGVGPGAGEAGGYIISE